MSNLDLKSCNRTKYFVAKECLVGLLIICTSMLAWGSSGVVLPDSVQKMAPESRLNWLFYHGKELSSSKSEVAIAYLKGAEELATDLDKKTVLLQIRTSLAIFFVRRGFCEEALDICYRSKPLATSLGDTNGLGDLLTWES